MNIVLKKPDFSFGTGQQGVSSTILGDSYTNDQSYTIKITLGPAA